MHSFIYKLILVSLTRGIDIVIDIFIIYLIIIIINYVTLNSILIRIKTSNSIHLSRSTPLIQLYPTYPTLPHLSNSSPYITYPALPFPFNSNPTCPALPTHQTLSHPSHYISLIPLYPVHPTLPHLSHSTSSNIYTKHEQKLQTRG